MTLLEFLCSNSVDNIHAFVPVSSRIADADGNPLLFKIKPMSQADFEDICQKSRAGTQINSRAFNNAVVIQNTIDPCFKDADAIANSGCLCAEQFLERSLLAGEIASLSDAIQKLSGFGDFDSLVDQAKN